METNRIIARLYYIFSILTFLRKVVNKKEVLGNILALCQGKGNITLTLSGNEKFKIRDMYDILAIKEVFDDEIYRFVFEGISKNTTLIDLGAYIADADIYAQQFPDVKKIIALEPMPENYKLALENIKLNGLKNVTLLKLAVSDKKGKVNLFIHPNKGQSGFWKKSKNTKKILVNTITLLDLVKKAKPKNLILKCDCEGAEYNMFLGTGNKILANFQKIVFEYHDDRKLKKIIIKLEKSGFRVNVIKHPVEPNLGTAYAERN